MAANVTWKVVFLPGFCNANLGYERGVRNMEEKGEWEQRGERRKGGGSRESGKKKTWEKGRFCTFLLMEN